MSAIDNIKKERIKKLENFRKVGTDPYPARSFRTKTLKEVFDNFDNLSKAKEQIILAGRIVLKREHGAITFCQIQDESGKFQLVFKKDNLGEKYKLFLDNFDIGDFIEAQGFLFITKAGERSLEVKTFNILTKSLLPLPEKWHGLKEIEERYRKRYLDLLLNKEVKEKFILRSKLLKELRKFLDEKGFIEVETPILQTIPGGATAKPFKTHLNILDIDLYLRIAPELYLKRLIVGGFEKIYEIGKNFRNEGIDKEHNPEFTMLELYYAYIDYEILMKFSEDMLSEIIKNIFNKFEIEWKNKKINFKPPFKRKDFFELFFETSGLDLEKASDKELFNKAKDFDIDMTEVKTRAKVIDEIYKKIARPNIIEPTFIINHPLELSPLAKKIIKKPEKVQRFQLIIGGTEVINGFSELNDPIDQRERFEMQKKMREAGDTEAQRIDKDFLEALEYGMPPTAGLGLGIDRLTAILTNSYSIKEVILFPLMKPKK